MGKCSLSQWERSWPIEIEFCTQCRWLLRPGWIAQELLTTFVDALGAVALIPGTGGIFEVRLDDELIFSRKAAGRFPELAELKQLVRDRIAPDKNLSVNSYTIAPSRNEGGAGARPWQNELNLGW